MRRHDDVMPQLTARADLAARLIARFPEQPVPAHVLSDHDAASEIQQDIQATFSGRPWTRLSIADWQMLGVPIAVCKLYMRPDAFAYYMISILHGSLETDGAFPLVLEALLPTNQRHVPRGAWWADFFGTFTAEQRAAILSYVRFIQADAISHDDIGSLVSAALDLYTVSP